MSASDAATTEVCVLNLHMHTFLMARGNQTAGFARFESALYPGRMGISIAI